MNTDELYLRWSSKWPDDMIINKLTNTETARLRFHTLDDAKRYATTHDEKRIILERYNSILDKLVNEKNLLVISPWWSAQDKIEPDSVQWRNLDTDNPDSGKLYVRTIKWELGVLDNILSDVADDKRESIIVAPKSLDWLYIPYDGGLDIFSEDVDMLNLLKDTFKSWVARK